MKVTLELPIILSEGPLTPLVRILALDVKAKSPARRKYGTGVSVMHGRVPCCQRLSLQVLTR